MDATSVSSKADPDILMMDLCSRSVGVYVLRLGNPTPRVVPVVVRPRRIDNSEPVHCATGAARADRTSYMLYVGH